MRTEEKEKRDKDPERGDEERERRYRERKVRGQAGGVLGICRVEAIHALLVGAFLKSVVTQDSKSEEILRLSLHVVLFPGEIHGDFGLFGKYE